MADQIRVPNYASLNQDENSTLNADSASGQKNITVLNVNNFQANRHVAVGELGSETCEIALIQSIAGNVITCVSNLKHNHKENETITQIKGNKLILYRATNTNDIIPPIGNFSALSTNAIDEDSPTTLITDSSGGTGYWYMATYYDDVTGYETPLTLSIAQRGGGYGHYTTIEAISKESGMDGNVNVTTLDIAERRDEAEDEVNSAIIASGYRLPLLDSAGNVFTPVLVEYITKILAAGFVLLKDYGPTVNGDTKDGNLKITEARTLLEKIQKAERILLDPSGIPLTRESRVSGWPDDTTETTGTDGFTPEPAAFSMGKKF